MKSNELIHFRSDLFFGGAVQLDWHESDRERAEFAAQNFVFHGPKYHGVVEKDNSGKNKLIDTATFTKRLLDTVVNNEKEEPISLAIAGYGSGKSHLGLTLATLLSTQNLEVKNKIISNIKSSDSEISLLIENTLKEVHKPFLVIIINGMKNFNLASELSRQSLSLIKQYNLDTKPLEDLWPRFKIANSFCQRNFDVRKDLFNKYFDNDESLELIKQLLELHDETIYEKVNKVYYQIVGSYINAQGQESPQDLIQTLSDSYCGHDNKFYGLTIFFDEFGRYLEFAAEKPQVAGDAAIQQLFEAIQNNKSTSSIVCFNQYELRTYLSRMSSDLQVTLQRYITRFDSAKKYYLSTNLETLFAHLIEKTDSSKITKYLSQPIFKNRLTKKKSILESSFRMKGNQTLWQDDGLFNKVIVQGCWPLDPLATWIVSNLDDILQNRSSIAIIKATLDKINLEIHDNEYSSISAVDLAKNGLIEEFIANEKQGYSTGESEICKSITEKIGHNISAIHNDLLLAVLLSNKLKTKSEDEAHRIILIASLMNSSVEIVKSSLDLLISEFGVLEWNSTQNKYDFIGDAIPRSKFLSFLNRQSIEIKQNQIEEVFANSGIEWCRVSPVKSSFSNIKKITTTEWEYKSKTTNLFLLSNDLVAEYKEWSSAFLPNEKRGIILYCYISMKTNSENASKAISDIVNEVCKTLHISHFPFPFIILPIHDTEGGVARLIAEYIVLTGNLDKNDLAKLRHFIEGHKLYLQEELPRLFNNLKTESAKKLIGHPLIQKEIDSKNLRRVSISLFDCIYNKIFSFNFDGFNTIKGNAAKDARELTIQLLTGQVSHDWVETKTSQFRNRFNNLLVSGPTNWDILDLQGHIRLYPNYEPVKILIKELETEIETNKEIDISKIIYKWLAPPYGMNIASAGLLLGVFLAPRMDSINILYNGDLINKSNWAQRIFKKNFIDLSELKKSKFKFIEEQDTNQWKKILEEWESVQNNRTKVEIEKNAYELETKIGQPPEALYYKWTLQIEKNMNVHDEINALVNKLNELEESYAYGLNKDNAEIIIHAANACYNKMNELEKSIPAKWDECEIIPFAEFQKRSNDGINEIFDIWLNNLYVGNVSQVEKFEKDKRKLCRYLQNIELFDLAHKLEIKIGLLTVNLNKQKKMSLIIDEAQKFQNTNYITDSTPMQNLSKIKSSALAIINDLKIKSSLDTSNKAPLQKIKEIQKGFVEKAEKQKKIQEEKLSTYYEKEKFTNSEKLEFALDELKHLKKIFIGRASDLEDIGNMIHQVELLLDAAKYILNNRNSFSLEDIGLNLNVLSKEYEQKIDSESEVIWDFKKTITPIFEETKAHICSVSRKWLENYKIDVSLIDDYSVGECKEKLRFFNNSPKYLTDDDYSIIQDWMALLQKQLRKNKLEAALNLYDELSEEQQQEFINRITNKVVEC